MSSKKKKKTPAIWNDMAFRLRDDHIAAGGWMNFFLRLQPRNMDVLTLPERMIEYDRLQNCIDSYEIAPSIFILDKTEGLDQHKEYYEELLREYPEHEFINQEILLRLVGMEQDSSCVERAFYLVLRVKNRDEFERFVQGAREQLVFHVADRAELLCVLRNFLLREYTAAPLLEWDRVMQLRYQDVQRSTRPQKRKALPEYTEFADMETMRSLLPATLRFDSRYVQQGDTLYRKTIAVRNYPAALETDSALRQLAVTPGITIRIYLDPIPQIRTTDMLRRQINEHNSAAISSRRASDRVTASVEQEQVIQSYRDMLTHNERMHFVTILIEVYGASPQELTAKIDRVRSKLVAQGFTKDDMLLLQRDGFLSMLPYGSCRLRMYKRNMPTRTIAALYPFTASKLVMEQGIPIGHTTAGGVVLWNPFSRTDNVTNGNVLIIGDSGQGKSYTLKKIVSMEWASGCDVYGLDSESEYIDLYRNMGGTNLDCAGGGTIINPLELRVVTGEDDRKFDKDAPEAFRGGSPLKQHLSWLGEFFPLLMPDITPRTLNVLMLLVQRHYSTYGIDDAFRPQEASPEQYPTFGTLYDFINELLTTWDTADRPEWQDLFAPDDLRDLLLAMRSAYDGAESAIFNGHTNIRTVKSVNFVIQALLEGKQSTRDAAMFNVLSWIWNRVVTLKRRTVVAIDELYLLLNPTIAVWLRNFEKRDRKYNAIIVTATQNLVDFDRPDILYLTKPLLSIPQHKFVFYPGDIDRAVLQRLLDLTESESNLIRASHRKHCLLKCGAEKYHVVIGTMDYEADLFGTAGGN